MMRAAMVPASMLEERRRRGHDRFDEVWEGVLHLVPFPSSRHQRIVLDLSLALQSLGKRRGLQVFPQVGIYDPAVHDERDYRGPDVVLVEPRYVSRRGIEGNARVVIEVVSPNDESREKLAFYARVGVAEVWLLDPQQGTLELFTGTQPVRSGEGGIVRSPTLGVELGMRGTLLEVRDGSETYTVDTAEPR